MTIHEQHQLGTMKSARWTETKEESRGIEHAEREQFTINSSTNDSGCVHKTKLHILLVWHKNSLSLCLPFAVAICFGSMHFKFKSNSFSCSIYAHISIRNRIL